jgi:hypothetical protein
MPAPPYLPKATLSHDECLVSLTSLDGRLYALTSLGRILQAQLDWTWIEVPGPAEVDNGS